MPVTETTIYGARALAAPRGRPYLVTFTLRGNDRADYRAHWSNECDALGDVARLKAMAPLAVVICDLEQKR